VSGLRINLNDRALTLLKKKNCVLQVSDMLIGALDFAAGINEENCARWKRDYPAQVRQKSCMSVELSAWLGTIAVKAVITFPRVL